MSDGPPLTSSRIRVKDSSDAVFDYAISQGWSDGLPIIPPTEDRVWGLVEGSGLPADHTVGIIPPALGEATIEKIAINAVMAGCLREYMPVLVATVEAICDEQFNLPAIQTTTNPACVGIVINGPIRNEIGVNSGRGCLGPGWRANATIGRAIRLVQLNVGGASPGEIDKAIHGFPGKYTLCFGEDEEGSPWEPLHVERGFHEGDSTATVNSFNGTLNIITSQYHEIRDMLAVVARDYGQMGSNNMILGKGEPAIVLTADHAGRASEAGMSKGDVKQFLYDNSGIPESDLRPMVRRHRIEAVTVKGMVHQTRKPEDLMLVVAGGPGTYHAVLMPTFGDSYPVTKLVPRGL